MNAIHVATQVRRKREFSVALSTL